MGQGNRCYRAKLHGKVELHKVYLARLPFPAPSATEFRALGFMVSLFRLEGVWEGGTHRDYSRAPPSPCARPLGTRYSCIEALF